MSVLAAVARRARAPQRSPALLLTRRCLGDTVAGPPASDFAANLKIATKFFTKTPVTYAEFKQQCSSLRIFVFAALNAGLALALFLDPPKSSYWMRMSPTYLFKSAFGAPSPPIFLTQKVEHETDVPDIYEQLTTTRRLLGAGSDSDGEE
eukprot:CAMPEP_0171172686 /NCGR_PEP_ID=MMETSP0790-20130122/9843_1 /TAXON_ID=2925 /ORGANISM="Alexandrium catenella, Strain OF101" /LENGTH=149 /DNA_ID=CAMNT_0011637543 /DNA_START=96 /DNA_END=545 /DNA_ORIENTATION=-